MLGAAVPEATVHEYRHLGPSEDQIGCPAYAWYRPDPDPVPKAQSVGGRSDCQLWARIGQGSLDSDHRGCQRGDLLTVNGQPGSASSESQ